MKENHVDLIALGPGTHMKWLLGFNPLQMKDLACY
jgi:hypothetical protein